MRDNENLKSVGVLKMTTSNIKVTLSCDIHKVWEIITAFKNYTWRSDLSKTEVISSRQFIEYTKEGYPTTFTITVTEPYKRWEFDMENSNRHNLFLI